VFGPCRSFFNEVQFVTSFCFQLQRLSLYVSLSIIVIIHMLIEVDKFLLGFPIFATFFFVLCMVATFSRPLLSYSSPQIGHLISFNHFSFCAFIHLPHSFI
jgi:hypothetical protein